jgi:predicted AlkP superfamily phosphohydrolase/phosphomutase
MPGFTSSGVRINLVGRERDGLVQLDDYERVCDEIEAEVLACTNPRTGKPVVRTVHRPRRDDPLAPDGDTVDIVFTWAEELIDAFEHPRHGLIGPIPAHRPGVHDRDGFLYVRADGLEPGHRGTRPASDIPATLLDLAGAEPTVHLDGSSVLSSQLG